MKNRILTSSPAWKSILYLIILLTALTIPSCQHPPNGITAFTNVNLVPMTGEIVLENQTVLVEDTAIIDIGASEQLKIPPGSEEIDGHGAYLMPGLADMHMHTRADWNDPDIWPVHPLDLYLANGVTTIRDFSPQGSPITYPLEWREEIHNGTRVGPEIYTSGILLFASPLDNPRRGVRQNYDMGFDFIKLYSYLSEEDFQEAVRMAKSLRMYTAGHIPYAVGLDGVLAENMDEIAHVEELLYEFINFDREAQLTPAEWTAHIASAVLCQLDMSSSTLQADFECENIETLEGIAAQLSSANIPICTTMVIDDTIQLKLFHPDDFLSRPENQYFEAGYLEAYQLGEEKHQVQCLDAEVLCAFKYDIDRWILSGLHDAGVMLLLGTDSGTGGMGIIPGFSIHDELRILVENGFTPYEAIATGTVNAAAVIERMTGEGNFGTIEVGKRADLILLDENPLENITTIKHPVGVMSRGRWYDRETLDQMIHIKLPTVQTTGQ